MADFIDPVTIDDLKKYAATHLEKNAFDYYSAGANDDVTLRENRLAFNRIKLLPRMLRDVSHQDISVTVLGHKLSMPICVSPTAFHAVAHPDGELGTVRAVTSRNTAMSLSILTTTTLEEVARESPNTVKFLQMQVFTDRQFVAGLLKRAEKAGYNAVLFTIDQPLQGRHKGRTRFCLPAHLKCTNFSSVQQKKGFKSNAELFAHILASLDGSIDWKILDWIRSITSLPIIVKGILTPEDARLAVQHGVQGILVSNHGGRQLDGVPATGEEGVTAVLHMLKDELKIAMALAGCASLKDITPSLVMRHPPSHL